MSQTQKVYEFIKNHGSITSWEAFQYLHITRLSARIYELDKEHPIMRETVTKKDRDGNVQTFTRYSLAKGEEYGAVQK